jgi:hypothetical protein
MAMPMAETTALAARIVSVFFMVRFLPGPRLA